MEWARPPVDGGSGPELDALAALAARAGRCALELARLEAPRPAGMQGELALHTALACGTVAAMHVGGVDGRFEFFITGEVRLWKKKRPVM